MEAFAPGAVPRASTGLVPEPLTRPQTTMASDLSDTRPVSAAAWAAAGLGLVALVVTNGLSGPGLSAFDNALIDEFGWDRATLKLRDTVTYAAAAVFLPAAGWAIDRFGVRVTMVAGTVLLGVGLFLYGSIGAAWHMYGIHVLFSMALALAGVGTVVIFVSSWFPPARRGAALGLAIAGTSVGGIVFSQLNARLLGTVGWRGTFQIEAGIAAAFAVLALVLVRRGPFQKAAADARDSDEGGRAAPEQGGGSLTFGEAVRTVPFWAIAGSGGLTYFSIVGVLTNLVLLAGDLGLEVTDGVNAISTLLLVSLFSKLGAGVVADWIGPYRLFRACFGVMATGLAGLALLQPSWLLGAAVVVGLGWGALFTLYNYVQIETFGLASAGKITNTISIAKTLGAGLGPLVCAWLSDVTGSYAAPFWMMMGFLLASLALSFLIRPLVGAEATPGA